MILARIIQVKTAAISVVDLCCRLSVTRMIDRTAAPTKKPSLSDDSRICASRSSRGRSRQIRTANNAKAATKTATASMTILLGINPTNIFELSNRQTIITATIIRSLVFSFENSCFITKITPQLACLALLLILTLTRYSGCNYPSLLRWLFAW